MGRNGSHGKLLVITLYIGIVNDRGFDFLWFLMFLVTMRTRLRIRSCTIIVEFVVSIFKRLCSRSCTSINDVSPIASSSGRQFFPSFHQKYTCIAYFTRSFFIYTKTFLEFGLILFAVSETGT